MQEKPLRKTKIHVLDSDAAYQQLSADCVHEWDHPFIYFIL